MKIYWFVIVLATGLVAAANRTGMRRCRAFSGRFRQFVRSFDIFFFNLFLIHFLLLLLSRVLAEKRTLPFSFVFAETRYLLRLLLAIFRRKVRAHVRQIA